TRIGAHTYAGIHRHCRAKAEHIMRDKTCRADAECILALEIAPAAADGKNLTGEEYRLLKRQRKSGAFISPADPPVRSSQAGVNIGFIRGFGAYPRSANPVHNVAAHVAMGARANR